MLRLRPEDQIEAVELLNPFNPKETAHDKLSVLDVLARDQKGRYYNVEMQMVPWVSLPQRFLYYWSCTYRGQLQEGQDYHKLRPTISICFLDAELFHEVPDYHLVFRLMDPKYGVVFTNDLEIHLLQLPKFDRRAEELTDPLEKWLYFLKYGEELDPENLPGPLRNSLVERATKELSMITQSEVEKQRYESRLKAQRDLKTMQIDFRAEGHAEGRAEGMAEGEVVGRIRAYQELLGETPFTDQELRDRTVEQLTQQAQELAGRLRARR